MSMIYEPSGRAKEYSLLAINHYNGCSHGCRYCYAASMAKRYGRNFKSPCERVGVIVQAEREARKLAGDKRRVLLSFMTDPYQPLDDTTRTTRHVIEVLREHRLSFQVLSKGGCRAARDFDLYGQHDAFASTLTCLDDAQSASWEPGAASPADRIAAIRIAHERGIQTWVSLEPVLDPDVAIQIVHLTHGTVDLYKVGILNHMRSAVDWRTFGIKILDVLHGYGSKYYIKHDLAKYLAGINYANVDTRMVG